MYEMLAASNQWKKHDQKQLDDAVWKLAWTRLQGKTIVDGDILIDRGLGEALEPKVGYTHKC